jgi:hypothetical protein
VTRMATKSIFVDRPKYLQRIFMCLCRNNYSDDTELNTCVMNDPGSRILCFVILIFFCVFGVGWVVPL